MCFKNTVTYLNKTTLCEYLLKLNFKFQMFDPKLTKKKKKKKTGFDIDSAIADPTGNSNNDANENNKVDKENVDVDSAVPEEEEALDLESFGKKKKKKKKTNFNLDDLDAALPETKKEIQVLNFFSIKCDFCFVIIVIFQNAFFYLDKNKVNLL